MRSISLTVSIYRSMAVLAFRHILRASYGLAVVYTSRWTKRVEESEKINGVPISKVRTMYFGVNFEMDFI